MSANLLDGFGVFILQNLRKIVVLTIFVTIGFITLYSSACAVEAETWGREINGLRCRLSAGPDRDEWNNVTELVLELQNTTTTVIRLPEALINGRTSDGLPVRGLIHLEIYGVDKEGDFLYRLCLPDVSNLYHAEWYDLVIEPGESYVQVIPLNDTRVMELSRYVPIGDGKLSPGEYTLIAILFGDTLRLRSLPLALTVSRAPTAILPCLWGQIKMMLQE